MMWVLLILPAIVIATSLLIPGLVPKSVFYKDGKPTRAGRAVNGVWERYAAWGGPPPWQVSLETRGRRTGRILRIPVAVTRHDEEDYLVSMLGERSAWVHNVRAAGGEAVLRHGRIRRVRLDEVAAPERAPILKAYAARARSGRRHFLPLTPQSSVGEFAAVADKYPVFRIVEMN
jgi:deazaflavin-dependent oxidoreductase (nitroreductase family)